MALTRNWPAILSWRLRLCFGELWRVIKKRIAGRRYVPTTFETMKPYFRDVAAGPFRIAPERSDDLLALMGGTPWEIVLTGGPAQFTAYPDAGRIDVAPAGLASLWALTAVGYRYMELASRVAAGEGGKAHDQLIIHADPVFGQMVDYARRLFVADEPWPDGLPQPVECTAFDRTDGRINNLFLAATAWVVLHEIGHIAKLHTALLGRELRLGQEHEADKFAVCWALDHAAGEQREFRVLAISVALAWLFLFEWAKRGGDGHPPAIVRFWQAASYFQLDEQSPALENAVYLLKGIFDPENPDMPSNMNPREAFEWIDLRLEELFPRG
ncbi:MAG: phage exclusion protein Lit family protein [Brevundimonas sp.]|uniref:phage exclusion protein Lit family protein n=1 Tax=Brevundimonas sp. TaxID=1871086 RepID=UPI00271F050E|nr:phage exclusion protein Lit family protein [Brevundimonas sp.]MDO9588806.1 phage exclusion protein Lit family protein [Brevundimonas sp.]